MKKYVGNISIYLMIFLFMIFMVIIFRFTDVQQTKPAYTYSTLLLAVERGEVGKIVVIRDSKISNAARVRVFKDKNSLEYEVVDIPAIEVFMQKIDGKVETSTSLGSKTNWFLEYIPTIVVMIISVFLLFFIIQQMQGGGGGGRVMSFGKTKAKAVIDEKNKIKFAQVAGLEEEKEDLLEVVEFLKQPKKFIDIGARIPRGILLVGPPGTGKTYLARACAGEAEVPFFSISGSDFVEMFVGVGASRVRDLFEQAKKSGQCIVFIDEIDAVGRKRGAGLGGGHDEREQTLNQLLVEMDGFGDNEGVIILAATNRPDILDPALLRPGRFDRRIVVGKPDVKGREAVLKVHAKGKKIAKNVDFKVVAQTTSGFTPADLENLLNESALLAARDDKKEISMEEMRRAFIKVGIGTEKKSRVTSEKERRITAFHEAGHAILFELLSEIDPTYMISIIPTGMAGGYTMPLPGDDQSYLSKKYMKQSITSLLGGRAAEEIIIKDITTGASNDIERATAMARAMVTKYGMSELGPIQFGDDNDEVFIGRDLAHTRNYGENVATQIDAQIKHLIESSYTEAFNLITEHIDVLHKIADALMEHEKVTGEDIRKFFPEGVLTHKIKEGFMISDAESEENVDPEPEIKEPIIKIVRNDDDQKDALKNFENDKNNKNEE